MMFLKSINPSPSMSFSSLFSAFSSPPLPFSRMSAKEAISWVTRAYLCTNLPRHPHHHHRDHDQYHHRDHRDHQHTHPHHHPYHPLSNQQFFTPPLIEKLVSCITNTQTCSKAQKNIEIGQSLTKKRRPAGAMCDRSNVKQIITIWRETACTSHNTSLVIHKNL